MDKKIRRRSLLTDKYDVFSKCEQRKLSYNRQETSPEKENEKDTS
jgi:hypothetical protein